MKKPNNVEDYLDINYINKMYRSKNNITTNLKLIGDLETSTKIMRNR